MGHADSLSCDSARSAHTRQRVPRFQNAAGENTSEFRVYGCLNLHVSREMHRTEHSFKSYYPVTDHGPSTVEIPRNYLTDRGGASHDFA